MSCPFDHTQLDLSGPATTTQPSPLAGDIAAGFPAQINDRYRVVSDPHQVKQILLQPDLFTPDNALLTGIDLEPATLRILAAERFSLPPVLASASGAAHRQVRGIVAGFFSPKKVAAQREYVESRVTQIVSELVTEARAAGDDAATVDLAPRLADLIPPEVMERMTGVPAPELADLKRFSRHSLELFWGWPEPDRQLELAHTAVEFHQWLRRSISEAIAADDGNLFAQLHAAGVDVDRIRSLGYFLTIAGQETTALLINTALDTALRGGQWKQYGESSAATSAFVTDVLAGKSSVPTWRRLASTDLEVDGVHYPAGQQLVLQLSGEQYLADSDDSLAFGFGLHRCLGAGLAQMETEAVVQTLSRLLPDLELAAEDPPWLHLLSFQAPVTVPVRLNLHGHGAKA
ncbi:cytochrome P450 [Micrococcoides hystricis]|uniref:Cytochrome P450 n=1 Tax=Micrococcoides hystricis TaxID=1572761 RepID=A0ABV6P7W2_9MICC